MNALRLLVISIGSTFVLSCVSPVPSPDISKIRRLDARETTQCQSRSGDIHDSNAHAFRQDDNMLELLNDAAENTVNHNGNAYWIKSMQMDYDHNKAKIVYQIFLCP